MIAPRRSEAVANLGETLRALPVRLNVASRGVALTSLLVSNATLIAVVLLLVFILHQSFLWASTDPEASFDRAAQLLNVVEISWDMTTVLLNVQSDLLNSMFIPGWNAGVFYIAEPTVFLVLEAFSLVFLGHEYEGVVSESTFPYHGIDCIATAEAARWCGRYAAYEQAMKDHESGFVNESRVFLGLRTARHLSELADDGSFATPVFSLDAVTDALVQVLTLGIVAAAPLADIVASVLDDVVTTSATVVFDSLWFLIRNLAMTVKMLVKSGLLTFLVGVGMDFLVIYYVYYALPILLALVDFVLCIMQLFLPSSWGEQLRCAELKCFRGPQALSDLWIFSSIPVVIKQFGLGVEALSNGGTARSFGSGMIGGLEAIAGLAGRFGVPASTEECAECFVCKFPELRMVWWVVAASFSIGSPSTFRTFSGNVSEHCMDNSSYYADVCGPRGAGAELLTHEVWKARFRTGWDPYDPDLIESYAGLFAKRAEELGGASSYTGGLLQLAADSWFLRDVVNSGDEEAAPFVYHACRLMRSSDGGQTGDIGPGYSEYADGSLSFITGGFLYAVCKRHRHETIGFGRGIHDVLHEALACVGSPVECEKDMERCVGVCGGADTNPLNHDFSTTIALAELSDEALGEGGAEAAHANCTVKSVSIAVDMFEGGDSFKTFAARIRVRSGMTAIDTQWCSDHPQSCGVVQRVLERSPGLVWANGAFRHGYDMSNPAPPPPPRPPPGLDYGGQPPPSPYPPPPPPPFWKQGEECIPLPSPEFAGPAVAREKIGAAPHEDRSACVFAKRLLDVRRKASACFSAVASPNPPPPPFSETASRTESLDLYRQRLARGEGEPYSKPTPTEDELYNEHSSDAMVRVEELIRELGQNQPILKSVLDSAVDELRQAVGQGRRLMTRETDYVTTIRSALSTSDVQKAVGMHGIPGLTGMSCESLCEAVSRDTNPTNTDSCSAYAFRRDDPDSATDFTGHCWLLTSAGACKPVDFATALWTRHIPSESICEQTRPGKDNAMCIGLPATRSDTLVLSHGDAAAIAAQLPDPLNPAPGAGGLPNPRSTLEAMCEPASLQRSPGKFGEVSGRPSCSSPRALATGCSSRTLGNRASKPGGRRPPTLRPEFRSQQTGSLKGETTLSSNQGTSGAYL